MEKRDFSRVGFRAGVVITWQGKPYKTEVLNLSLHGILVKEIEGIAIGEKVDLTIYLSGTTPEIPLTVKGEVVRLEQEGVGIQFCRMDTDSFIHLRNIVALNLGDQEKVMDEFIKFHSR